MNRNEGGMNMLTREDKDFINKDENINKVSVELRGNSPCFTDGEIKQLEGNISSFLDLDDLNRCGVAFACISNETLSNGQGGRPSIKSKPTGFF